MSYVNVCICKFEILQNECPTVHVSVCVLRCVKAHVSLADLGRQHTLESDENSSTFLPAMPLISWIRLTEIAVLLQIAFVPTLALTKLWAAAAHIFFEEEEREKKKGVRKRKVKVRRGGMAEE